MKRIHPLSGEELVVREVINKILDTARLDILRAVNNLSLPTTQDDITTRAGTSRKTTKAHLSELRERGFIKSYRNQIEPTAGGKLLLERAS